MCIAVPVEIIEVYENEALANFNGVKMKINTYLLDNLNAGDYVLLHVGCAIQKIDKKEAEQTLKLFESILKD